MKKIYSLSALVLTCVSVNAQTPNWVWSKKAGGTSSDYGKSICTDANGNIYATGYFESSAITFGSFTLTNEGWNDIFLVKYDAMGNVVWARGAGGNSDDRGISISTDANGNCYITGSFRSDTLIFGSTTLTNAAGLPDVFVVKYDNAGNVIWARSAGGNSDDIGNGITTDANGNVLITGTFVSSSITFGSITLINTDSIFGFTWDFFAVKYDAAGNVLWAKSIGANIGDEMGYGISTDATGNVYVTGSFSSPSVTIGSNTLTSAGLSDIFIVKYDGAGNALWAKRTGGTSWDGGTSIKTDANGNSYIAGSFYSSAITFGSTTLTNAGGWDIFLVKYDGSGNVSWAKTADGGGVADDYIHSISIDPAGNSYVSGTYMSSSITFDTTVLINTSFSSFGDIFIVQYNSSGNVVWVKSASGDFHDFGYGISTDAGSNVYVIGSFSSSFMAVGSDTLPNASPATNDIFVAKISPGSSSIEENNYTSQSILVYPNPGRELFFFKSENKISTIEIVNLLGEKIYISKINFPTVEIDLSKQPKGIYFYQITSKNKNSATGKLIIQ